MIKKKKREIAPPLREFTFTRVDMMQRTVFMANREAGLFYVTGNRGDTKKIYKDISYDESMRERYLEEKKRFNKEIFIKIEPEYMIKQTTSWFRNFYYKCDYLGIDYIIIPFTYVAPYGMKANALGQIVEKLNRIIYKGNTKIILENYQCLINEIVYIREFSYDQCFDKILYSFDIDIYEISGDIYLIDEFNMHDKIKLIKTDIYSADKYDIEVSPRKFKELLDILKSEYYIYGERINKTT